MRIYVRIDHRECFKRGMNPPDGFQFVALPDVPSDLTPSERELLAANLIPGRDNGIAPSDCTLENVIGVPTWEAVRESLGALRAKAKDARLKAEQRANDVAARELEQREVRKAIFDVAMQDRARLAQFFYGKVQANGRDTPGAYAVPYCDYAELMRYFAENSINHTEFFKALRADYDRVVALRDNWLALWTVANSTFPVPAALEAR